MKKHNDLERDKTETLSPQSMPENSEEIPKPKGYPSSEREALELIDQAYRAYTYYLMFERRKLNLRETAIVVGRVARSLEWFLEQMGNYGFFKFRRFNVLRAMAPQGIIYAPAGVNEWTAPLSAFVGDERLSRKDRRFTQS
jgi:hypothetical protein